jgi:2-hydroxy-3-keto-5-methylthiopentenyl-1-phosphate phosphatase
MALKLFVDFDGTVTTQDVGNAFFRRFGGPACDGLVRDYRDGKMSAQECFRGETAAIGRLPLAEAETFLREQQISPGFATFVEFCRARGIEFHIVSDGLDYYVGRILALNGIDGVSVFANTLTLSGAEEGSAKLTVSFPYGAAECDRCACCKRNIILTRAGEDDVIGYIGEGFSDRCAAQYADIVFAKDELQKYCQQENISYYLYNDFHDVLARLELLVARKSLRKRRRAENKRREAFMREA